MASLLGNALAILAVLGAVACSENGVPSSPTASDLPPAAAPTPAPVSTNAVPIALGETVQQRVATSDPPCDTPWGGEPCQRFAVTVPTAGILSVRVTSHGPVGLTLWVNARAFWGAHNEITGTTLAQAAGTYEVAVSMHDPQSTSQLFELTTSLE